MGRTVVPRRVPCTAAPWTRPARAYRDRYARCAPCTHALSLAGRVEHRVRAHGSLCSVRAHPGAGWSAGRPVLARRGLPAPRSQCTSALGLAGAPGGQHSRTERATCAAFAAHERPGAAWSAGGRHAGAGAGLVGVLPWSAGNLARPCSLGLGWTLAAPLAGRREEDPARTRTAQGVGWAWARCGRRHRLSAKRRLVPNQWPLRNGWNARPPFADTRAKIEGDDRA